MKTRSAQGLAFETTYLASKGYWPKQINPLTGEVAPAVELVPPMTVTYTLTCGAGHVLERTKTPTVRALACKECRRPIPPTEITVEETASQTPGFELVGDVYYDGLTSTGGWYMEEQDERRGRGEIIGGEGTALGKGTVIRSGSQAFGGNARADYGFAQTRMRQLVSNALSIPNLVEGPVFTALTLEVDEGSERVSKIGPLLVGKALSTVAPQWFGNVFETGIVIVDKLPRRRLYLEPYTDAEGREHLLKNSSSGTLPPYLEDPAKGRGEMFAEFNLGKVFRLLDLDLAKALETPVAGMPGLTGTPDAYGDGVPPTALPPTAASEPPVQQPTKPSQPAVAATPAEPVVAATPNVPAVAPSRPTARPRMTPGGQAPPPPGMRPPLRAPGSGNGS